MINTKMYKIFQDSTSTNKLTQHEVKYFVEILQHILLFF